MGGCCSTVDNVVEAKKGTVAPNTFHLPDSEDEKLPSGRRSVKSPDIGDELEQVDEPEDEDDEEGEWELEEDAFESEAFYGKVASGLDGKMLAGQFLDGLKSKARRKVDANGRVLVWRRRKKQPVEVLSTDSDIVEAEEVVRYPASRPAVDTTELERILEEVSGPLHEATLAKLTITRDMVPEFESGGTLSHIAEQFVCHVCDNFIVANFDFGTDGVKESSVRIPECRVCERMACYMCWYKHLSAEGECKCPSCEDVVEVPDKERFRNGYNIEIEQYMQFVNKKAILTILFQLHVRHECDRVKRNAVVEVEHKWNEAFEQLLEEASQPITFMRRDSQNQDASSVFEVEGGSDSGSAEVKRVTEKVAAVPTESDGISLDARPESKKSSLPESKAGSSGSGSSSSGSQSGEQEKKSQQEEEEKSEAGSAGMRADSRAHTIVKKAAPEEELSAERPDSAKMSADNISIDAKPESRQSSKAKVSEEAKSRKSADRISIDAKSDAKSLKAEEQVDINIVDEPAQESPNDQGEPGEDVAKKEDSVKDNEEQSEGNDTPVADKQSARDRYEDQPEEEKQHDALPGESEGAQPEKEVTEHEPVRMIDATPEGTERPKAASELGIAGARSEVLQKKESAINLNEAQIKIDQQTLERPISIGSARSDIRPPSRAGKLASEKSPSTAHRLELFPQSEPIDEIKSEFEQTGAAVSPVAAERRETELLGPEVSKDKDSEIPTTPKTLSEAKSPTPDDGNQALMERLAELETTNARLAAEMAELQRRPTVEAKSVALSVRQSLDQVTVQNAATTAVDELQAEIERLERENTELKQVKEEEELARQDGENTDIEEAKRDEEIRHEIKNEAIDKFVAKMIFQNDYQVKLRDMEDEVEELVKQLLASREAKSANSGQALTLATGAKSTMAETTLLATAVHSPEPFSPDVMIKSTFDETVGVPTQSNREDRPSEMDASLPIIDAKGLVSKETSAIIDDAALAARKTMILDKIASQIYQTEYTYLEFLNHTMADCDSGLVVEDGCPLRKCKSKGQKMTFNDFRTHLVNDCTKIKMVCNICGESMRRPWIPYHNCIAVYQGRIEDKNLDINKLDQELVDATAAHSIEVQVKEMKILELEYAQERQEEQRQQRLRIDEALKMKITGPEDYSLAGSRLASRQGQMTEMQNTHMTRLLTKGEMPDLQDSVSLADGSKFFDEKDLSQQEFFSRADPSQSPQLFQNLNMPTQQSVGIQMTQASHQSRAIGAFESRSIVSQAAGPSVFHEAASQGVQAAPSRRSQAMGAFESRSEAVSMGVGSSNAHSFMSNGNQAQPSLQIENVDNGVQVSPSIVSGGNQASPSLANASVQRTEVGAGSVGIQMTQFSKKDRSAQPSTRPDFISKGMGSDSPFLPSRKDRSQAAAPSMDGRVSPSMVMMQGLSAVDVLPTKKSLRSQMVGGSQAMKMSTSSKSVTPSSSSATRQKTTSHHATTKQPTQRSQSQMSQPVGVVALRSSPEQSHHSQAPSQHPSQAAMPAGTIEAQSNNSKNLGDLRANVPMTPQTAVNKLQMTQSTMRRRDSQTIEPSATLENAETLSNWIQQLQMVEKDFMTRNPFVNQMVLKYKNFIFNLKMFIDDEQAVNAQFSEGMTVPSGQFQGQTFWGMHIAPGGGKFKPHGFGILHNPAANIVHFGSFSQGKEFGQQRMIKTEPQQGRYFTQFTSLSGVLQGPALVERANGIVEVGNYEQNKRHGVWRFRKPDGQQPATRIFEHGKVQQATDQSDGSKIATESSNSLSNRHPKIPSAN